MNTQYTEPPKQNRAQMEPKETSTLSNARKMKLSNISTGVNTANPNVA